MRPGPPHGYRRGRRQLEPNRHRGGSLTLQWENNLEFAELLDDACHGVRVGHIALRVLGVYDSTVAADHQPHRHGPAEARVTRAPPLVAGSPAGVVRPRETEKG